METSMTIMETHCRGNKKIQCQNMVKTCRHFEIVYTVQFIVYTTQYIFKCYLNNVHYRVFIF